MTGTATDGFVRRGFDAAWRPLVWTGSAATAALVPDASWAGLALAEVAAVAMVLAERTEVSSRRVGLHAVVVLVGVALVFTGPPGIAPVPMFVVASTLPRLVESRATVVTFGVLLTPLTAVVVAEQTRSAWGLTAGLGVLLLLSRAWGRGELHREHDRVVALLAEREARRDADLRAAAADERARIARDLHDVLAHSLSGLSLQLQGVRAMLAGREDIPGSATESLDRAAELARSGIGEAKAAVAALRAEPALRATDLADLVATHPDAVLEVEGSFDALEDRVRAAAYATVRESLTNAARHAPGAAVRVVVRTDPGLRVVVRDEGGPTGTRGAPSSPGGGMGLRGLRERAAGVGGSVEAGPQPGGWRVALSVPPSPVGAGAGGGTDP